ncbi:MAG: hypothetical protein M3393_10340 [Actinomycetota bacterium]|nr:hypothetical protein [Actinomycetota bacterium]
MSCGTTPHLRTCRIAGDWADATRAALDVVVTGKRSRLKGRISATADGFSTLEVVQG